MNDHSSPILMQYRPPHDRSNLDHSEPLKFQVLDRAQYIAIAAVDPQGVIGKEGKLPWHYPEDLKHFHRSTQGQVVIMGYSTFLSLPSRVIDERTCFVFTKNHSISRKNVTAVKNLEELQAHGLEKTNFVIGGSSIFNLFFTEDLIDEAWITHIHKCYAGDAYFPMHFIANGSTPRSVDNLEFERHQSGPSSNDRSSPILMQYRSPRDRSNLSHSEPLKFQVLDRSRYIYCTRKEKDFSIIYYRRDRNES